ncbi:MAG: hypothetical protein Q7S87_03230 [Agitococcus sp.]|nr:hypothetical protein [Agitococcus sp.]
MNKIEAVKFLKDKALTGGADATCEPAAWMVEAVTEAVMAERLSCAAACMTATLNRAMKIAVGDAAHYIACSKAIEARSSQA